MKNLTKHVQNINDRYSLWSRGATLILGVSGGRDSMCLLDVMTRIAQKEHLTLAVAHVNYGLRGQDAHADQVLVEDTAKKYGIPCEVRVFDVASAGSAENAWRMRRRDHFRSVAEKYSATQILLGHTMDDQAETLLLHLLRGAGLDGLRGMRIKSSFESLHIGRPFLDVERSNITAHCKKYNLLYHDDCTNDDDRFTRNSVRHRLIPYLKRNYNPNLTQTLARSADIIADDLDAIPPITPFWTVSGNPPQEITFLRDDFVALSLGERNRVLRLLFCLLTDTTSDLSFGFIQEAAHALSRNKNKAQHITSKRLIIQAKGAKVKIMLQA